VILVIYIDPTKPALTRCLSLTAREVIRQVALGLRNAEVAARLGIWDVTVKIH
jgi:DNA-binding CsgD family transcriptional regulator